MRKVAILTAGGLAPCLSSSIASLLEEYQKQIPNVTIICYKYGYQGLLLGDSVVVSENDKHNVAKLHKFGGSPIGNSRVKLTNVDDCVKRKLIREGQNPLQVAADQLVKDEIDVLHTIGGDDTNTTAADLAKFLKTNNYNLQVVGLPKTVDNDVYPITQSLGAWTAAEESAKFFEHIVTESTANPNMLIVHEVMGRNCGWLTAQSAIEYRKNLATKNFLPNIGLNGKKFDVHGIYLPEISIDIEKEAKRLKQVMENIGNVNLFVSEGACINEIIESMKINGEEIKTDAFGHVKLDSINPGKWFGSKFAKKIGAEKVLVQKSGYFARSSKASIRDLELIKQSAILAVQASINGKSGVIGLDEDNNNKLSCISFNRIKGGKPFDIKKYTEFQSLLNDIGQIL